MGFEAKYFVLPNVGVSVPWRLLACTVYVYYLASILKRRLMR